jgi:hypothetical protein
VRIPCCREKEILGTEVSIADAFRFKGALPEVANCRLAMLGELQLRAVYVLLFAVLLVVRPRAAAA